MIAGRDSPTPGEAKNSWLTGTAAWNYVAATQWILGIRPEIDGLRIDPRLPVPATGLRMTRRFRGATYRITVHPDPDAGDTRDGEMRVTRLVVDGTPVEGNLSPLPGGQREVQVEAFMGIPTKVVL
ncbi:MAG: GH36-type glycosyl hydrolase domain-containing protein, partial [Isosphaeraceae bacterium]